MCTAVFLMAVCGTPLAVWCFDRTAARRFTLILRMVQTIQTRRRTDPLNYHNIGSA